MRMCYGNVVKSWSFETRTSRFTPETYVRVNQPGDSSKEIETSLKDNTDACVFLFAAVAHVKIDKSVPVNIEDMPKNKLETLTAHLVKSVKVICCLNDILKKKWQGGFG